MHSKSISSSVCLAEDVCYMKKDSRKLHFFMRIGPQSLIEMVIVDGH